MCLHVRSCDRLWEIRTKVCITLHALCVLCTLAIHNVHTVTCAGNWQCTFFIACLMSIAIKTVYNICIYTVEPLYNSYLGTQLAVLYREVPLIQR